MEKKILHLTEVSEMLTPIDYDRLWKHSVISRTIQKY